MGTTKHAAILCLAATAAAAPAASDDHAPRTLRMRERPRTRLSPIPLGRRVAQIPDSPPGDPANPPPGDPTQPSHSDPSAQPPSGAAPAGPSPGQAPTDPYAGPAPAASSPDAAPASPSSEDAPPASSSTPSPPPAAPAAKLSDERGPDNGKTEVISVTDTPVEHKLFTGRAPVTVVTRSDLATSGHATLGDILQALPVNANATNAQVNAGGDGTTRINLRGLGAPRTLVLLNGRRVAYGGNGADSSVDINAIPLPMIERVEIMKDGASALYGADGVGGVVNLVTRPQFDGTDVSLLTSTSQHGDGTEYDASIVTGLTTSDKNTYLVVSGGFQQHDPVLAGDRAFSLYQDSYDFATRTATRNASTIGPDGRIDTSSIGPGGMRPPGCTSDVCKPAAGGFTNFEVPRDLYNEAATNYVYTPSSRYNLFATAGNRLNDNMTLLLELLYLHRNSDRQLPPVAFNADAPISKDSIYNPLGGDILDFRRRLTELGGHEYIDHIAMFQFVIGAHGNVPESWGVLKDWKWEVSHNYGVTDSVNGTAGGLNKPKAADALGPSMIYNGTPICVRKPGDPSTQIIYTILPLDGSGPPIRIPCVPANLLLPAGTIPADQLKLLTYTGTGNGTDTTHTTLATASGRIAELPNHGDISLSLGGDYRKEDGDIIPTGIRVPDYLTEPTAETTQGRFHIYEGFGELSVVPISGNDIAQHVEIDLGLRALRHSRNGSITTYKAGGLFRTVEGIAVRGTYATAFRSPTVPDLFLGRTEVNTVAEDPCDSKPPSVGDGTRVLDPMAQSQCTAQGVPVGSKFNTGQQTAITGGNSSLQPETAATTTFGLVVEPPQLKGLAVTADYWRIDIDNAIETLGMQTIFANCYDRGVQSYCDQIHRDPATHRITAVDTSLQNVTRTMTSGIDLALWYDTRFAGFRRIHTGLEAQYLLAYDLDTSQQVIHGVGFYDLGVYPRYKANLSSTWIHASGATGGFTLRYVGSYKECAGDDCNLAHNLAVASRDVDRYFKLDLFGGYDFRSVAGKTTVQIGINNVFDATPPVVYNAPAANSDARTYDFVGRMVYLRLSQLF
ncbi:MAG TPA: TonB-dependent receptor [Kofleriaceae bacterium]